MIRRLAIWGAALLLLLLLAAPAALADESGCLAKVTLLSGEVMPVRNFGARLLQEVEPGTEMVVLIDGGQAFIDLRDLLSLTRLGPPQKVGSGQWVSFAFAARDGSQGTLKMDGGYYLCGRFDLGDWNVIAGEVQQVVLDCVPLK